MKICVKETVDPIPYIYQKNMVEISTQANRDIVAAHLPTFPSIKSVLYSIRRGRVPPLSKYRNGVHFEGEGEAVFRKTAALAFVSVHLVRLAWQDIKSGPQVLMFIWESMNSM